MKVMCVNQGGQTEGVPSPEVGSIYHVDEVFERTCACGKCFRIVYYRIDELHPQAGYPESLFAPLPGSDNEESDIEEVPEEAVILDAVPFESLS